jgi:hypothetical protein
MRVIETKTEEKKMKFPKMAKRRKVKERVNSVTMQIEMEPQTWMTMMMREKTTKRKRVAMLNLQMNAAKAAKGQVEEWT